MDTKHPLATYLRVMGAEVSPTTFSPRMGFKQKMCEIDSSVRADVFQACVCRELLGAMSPRSRRRAEPSPEDFLRMRFRVRLREYREVGIEERGEDVRTWATEHGNEVLTRLEEPWVLVIWQEITSEADPRFGSSA